MRKTGLVAVLVVAGALTACAGVAEEASTAEQRASGSRMIGVNVLLNTAVTDAILADIGRYGRVRDVIGEISALTLQAEERSLGTIQALPYVAAANPDAERGDAPVAQLPTDFSSGLNTWDQDAVNVTDFGKGRTIGYDGSGVYVAVLDTGLTNAFTYYFPLARIAVEYGRSFGGGGGEMGTVSSQPVKWMQDTNSHGTHVTSTIIGYNLRGTPINGVAPKATIIPVKVLNQNGSGWSSVIARGIVYVANLKMGPLSGSPVVINTSLGGRNLDAVEKAAIDYAVSAGVIHVASAGNSGTRGMGYPGAYAPVISVAASGWVGEWVTGRTWWYASNVADPTDPDDFYITDFSSREKPGQDLDVAAPGSWVVGPFETNAGQATYYFLGGTSMASPHVAGIVALMLQKNPTLTAADVETILEGSATPLPAGCRLVTQPSGANANMCWAADATGAGLATADEALEATP
jgi:subtilisin family serine protease